VENLLKKFLITFGLTLLLLPLDQLSAATDQPPPPQGEIFTFWPLVDYRKDTAKNTSSLSILGPLLNFESTTDDNIFSFRPLIHNSKDINSTRSFSYFLYPLASTETTPDVDHIEFLQIIQKNTYRKSEPEEKERQAMLFPFYISGESKKHVPYTSLFPFYGDIYDRFWRDEYHYVLFPIYGRTVLNKTTNYHFLWPFFSLTSGENESGFGIWPLYGQSAKEGVYSNSYFLWPIFTKEKRVIAGGETSNRLSFFPLYASYDTPHSISRHWLWPFFGYSNDTEFEEKERDYFWPFWLTISGNKRNVVRFLPFYSDEVTKENTKSWYLWPLFETDTMQSPSYRQKRTRMLYFLFSNKTESWAYDEKERQRTTMWPLFLYNRNTDGESSLSIPAPVEPILDREGIDKLWAPFWRLYIHKWNDKGDSQLSILWNLYWHDFNRETTGLELFPLFRRRSAPSFYEFQILKGLVKYTEEGDRRALSALWIPFGFSWHGSQASQNEKEGTR
jgi:hypothetical protein